MRSLVLIYSAGVICIVGLLSGQHWLDIAGALTGWSLLFAVVLLPSRRDRLSPARAVRTTPI